MFTGERTHYKRNIKIAIVVSELLVIFAFLFSPRSSILEKVHLYNEPLLVIDKIQQTIQKIKVKKQRPEIPVIYISNEIDAFEILEDVEIDFNFENNLTDETTVNSNNDAVYMTKSVPRQMLEVLPSVDKNKFEGQLQLSLKINERGEVIAHEILFNSLTCADCLDQLITAAYKSRWEAGIISGKKSDYWVKKSYIFN